MYGEQHKTWTRKSFTFMKSMALRLRTRCPVRKAVQKQQSVVELYPGSSAAKAFSRLAQTVDAWPIPTLPTGHLEFFVDALVNEHAAAR